MARVASGDALFDAHRDDPEFSYRFLVDEARADGHVFADRTAWKLCSENGWFSVFGKKKPRNKSKPGTPAYDDLVGRQFCAVAPNVLWLVDITEHWTDEGKLYCARSKTCSPTDRRLRPRHPDESSAGGRGA